MKDIHENAGPLGKVDRGGPLQPLLIVKELKKYFPLKRGYPWSEKEAVRAVDDVSFHVLKGETLGVVGESGCGKSTTARLLNLLLSPDSGEIIFDGDPVGVSGGLSVQQLRRQAQMVFQDSHSSLNPRLPILDSITFGLKAWGCSDAEARDKGREMLALVGLAPDQFATRYPHQLSGGQRQRVNIARALAMNPRLVVLDEAVSALDKSVEAQVLNLLQDLKARFGLTYIFISHDLNVVQYISDRVMVMYLGHVVEIGPVEALYASPQHPYTEALLASRLSMDPRKRLSVPPLTGDPPNPISPPSGCPFRTRCAIAADVCASRLPVLSVSGDDESHLAACLARQPGSGHPDAPASDAGAGKEG